MMLRLQGMRARSKLLATIVHVSPMQLQSDPGIRNMNAWWLINTFQNGRKSVRSAFFRDFHVSLSMIWPDINYI